MMTIFSLSQTFASLPNSRLNTPMVPGPQTSWVMSTSAFTQTLSPACTDFLPDARARIFSVNVISSELQAPQDTRAIVRAQHRRYTSKMSETWDFLRSPSAGAAFNMALDETLLRSAGKRGRPLVRVYSWEKPAITFGYFQKFPANLADGHEVVRRPTGGGVVYHLKDTTYTVIVPPVHAFSIMATMDAYWLLHRAVAASFEARPDLHVAEVHSPQGQYECFQKPVHGDVVTDGRKLAGGAQRRTKSGMLHQGSIDAKISAEQLKRGFREALGIDFEGYEVTDAERTVAEKLVVNKYATDAWNRHLR